MCVRRPHLDQFHRRAPQKGTRENLQQGRKSPHQHVERRERREERGGRWRGSSNRTTPAIFVLQVFRETPTAGLPVVLPTGRSTWIPAPRRGRRRRGRWGTSRTRRRRRLWISWSRRRSRWIFGRWSYGSWNGTDEVWTHRGGHPVRFGRFRCPADDRQLHERPQQLDDAVRMREYRLSVL